MRVSQYPPWQRPMVARVRTFTPLTVRTPRGLWMAWRISALVTFSQRQKISP